MLGSSDDLAGFFFVSAKIERDSSANYKVKAMEYVIAEQYACTVNALFTVLWPGINPR